ncbi:hypothetical protein GCM10010272_70610 [Streptomyces lateritius]|nr:hypothetical protein GCM10010272_70610 [Streptomyces lateritius]
MPGTPTRHRALYNVSCSGADSWQVGRYPLGILPSGGDFPGEAHPSGAARWRVRNGMDWIGSVEQEM